MTLSFWPHYGPGVDSASNRNEYQEYLLSVKGGWCLGLTNLPLSCADCLEPWEPQISLNAQGLSRRVQELLYFYLLVVVLVVVVVVASSGSSSNVARMGEDRGLAQGVGGEA